MAEQAAVASEAQSPDEHCLRARELGIEAAEVRIACASTWELRAQLRGVKQRHGLARTSKSPGQTQLINFFELDAGRRLVDLPGYGFAKVSKSTAKDFQNLGRAYLRGRPNLKRVYLLIDARHGLKTVDSEALDALDTAAVSYQIVLTKADKLKPAEVEKVVQDTLKAIARRPAAFPRVLATSSEKGMGLPQLRAEIVLAAFQ
jgi:GTP-binding protein